MESLIKNLWKLFYYGKNKNIFWFVNNSEYHHREMGLIAISITTCRVKAAFLQLGKYHLCTTQIKCCPDKSFKKHAKIQFVCLEKRGLLSLLSRSEKVRI